MNRIFLAIALLSMAACAVPRDASRVQYQQHEPTAWRTTPGGHRRDAGPFDSVAKGLATEEDLDSAVDGAYVKFAQRFPDLAGNLRNLPVTLNDDYAMWIPDMKSFASGVEFTGSGMIGVCIWTRAEGAIAPAEGSALIIRPPGNYFGQSYPGWRWTSKPLCPALVHELLHSVVGDAGHKDVARWRLADQP